MSKIKHKSILRIGLLAIFILFIFIGTSIAASGDWWYSHNGDWRQGGDWYSSGQFAREFQSKFLNVDASTLVGKKLWGDRDFWSNEPAVCIGGTDGGGAYAEHQIAGIIDINYDGPNTVNIYKNGKSVEKITGNKWYNAMAEVAKDSSGRYIQDNTYGKGYLGSAFARIMIQNLKSKFKEILGVNPVASTAYAGNTFNYLSYYNNCVKNGENVVNNTNNTTFKHTSDYDSSDVEIIKDESNYYIGPLKYDSSEKVVFNSIEITGKNGSSTVYSNTIKTINKDVLFVKNSKGSFVGKDSVSAKTAFYVKVNSKVKDASNVTVKITVGAGKVSYCKSRIVLLKSVGSWSCQNFAVLGGVSTSKEQDSSITFECAHDKGVLRIVKKGLSTSEEPIKMGFRLYFLSGSNKKYLKLTTKDNNTTGDITIKIQDVVDSASNATVVYTTSDTGVVKLRNINTGNYYIEEVTTNSDYSANIVKAQSREGTGNWTDAKVNGGIIGPVTVKEKPDTTQTELVIKDDIKRGTLRIQKRDSKDTSKGLKGAGFKLKFGDVWVKAATDNGNGTYSLKNYSNYSTDPKYYAKNFVEDEADATEFKTNANGNIEIKNLDNGTYTIKETTAPEGYAKNQITKATFKIGSGQETECTVSKGRAFKVKIQETQKTVVTCYNKNEKGNLTIYKRDYDLNSTDVDASFVLKENNKYLKLNNLNEITGDTDIKTKTAVSNASQATKITISDGTISIQIANGTYIFEEVETEYGYKVDKSLIYWNYDGYNASKTKASDKDIQIKVEASQTQKLYIYNVRQTGNLEIIKTDKDTNTPMVGVQFRIKDSTGKYIILTNTEGTEYRKISKTVKVAGLKTTTDASLATIFQTNENGKILIYNLLIGTYTLEEVNTGTYKGYDVKDGNYIYKNGTKIGSGNLTVSVTRQRSYAAKSNSSSTTATAGLPNGIYQMESIGSANKVVTAGMNDNDKFANGVQFLVENNNESTQQKFYLAYSSTVNAYKLTNLAANRVVSLNKDASGEFEIANESPVVTYSNSYSTKALQEYWTIVKSGNYYLLKSMYKDNLYLYARDGVLGVYKVSSVPTNNNFKFKFNATKVANKLEIANQRKYVKVSGTVWEDVAPYGTKEAQSGDNLYNEDDDITIQGIKVCLMENGGTNNQKEIATTITDKDGNYSFSNVEINKLDKYYIMYWYDGEIYTTVASFSGEAKNAPVNSSKAKEGATRDELNNKYQNVTSTNNNDQSKVNGNNNESFNVKYTLNEGNPEDATAITKYRESFEKALDEGNNVRNVAQFPETEQYGYIGANKMSASTSDTGYFVLGGTNQESTNLRNGKISNGSETINSIRQNGIEELANRNCGLTERRKIDLSVTSNVENVKVTVNGYTNNYKNDSIFDFEDNIEENDTFRTDVKTGFYGITRRLYKSDIAWFTDNPNLCEVYVTYKMSVHNNSMSLSARVTDLLGYYDSENYTVNEVYYVDENGEKKVQANINSTEVPGDPEETKYSLLHYELLKDTLISGMHSKSFYVTFKVNPATVTGVINKDKELENAILTEINTYTTYDQKNGNNVYASIDADSAPGNCQPGNKETYEDDTAISPSVTLALTTEERTISGTVFEDEQTDSSKQANERLGDGTYKENENTVSGVTVELLKYNETNLLPATLYLYKEIEEQQGGERNISGINTSVYERISDEHVTNAIRNTDKNGKYEFTGIIPDKYILKFTYADGNVVYKEGNTENGETIKANDYKATIIKSPVIKDALNNNGIVGDNSKKSGYIYGYPANKWYLIHEEERYSDAMDNNNEISRQTTENKNLIINNASYKQENSAPKSAYTGVINVQLEIDATSRDDENTTSTFRVIKAIDSEENDVYYQENHIVHETKDIDFGIIQKAKQQYEIKKEISNVRIILANGQVLVDGNPSSNNLQYTQFLPNIKAQNDMVKLELDNELMHGATLEITYKVIAINNAENNYSSVNYYKYGSKENNDKPTGTMQISRIIDYIDNDLTAVITDDENNIISGKLITNDGQDPIIMLDKGEPIAAKQYLTDDVINSAKDYKQVLMLMNETDIEPGKSRIWEYKATKLLTLNNNDDLEFTNTVEGIEYKGASNPPTNIVPGNFDPNPNPVDPIKPEIDNYQSDLIITSPTGGNRSYVIYIVVASAAVALAIGVYFVKKRAI